jgi:hypothetical protein
MSTEKEIEDLLNPADDNEEITGGDTGGDTEMADGEYGPQDDGDGGPLPAAKQFGGVGSCTDMEQTDQLSETNKVNYSDSISSHASVAYSDSVDVKGYNAAYVQCKVARTAGLQTQATNVSFGTDSGKSVRITRTRVGSLVCEGDADFASTYRGSRVSTDGTQVNQNIAFSFDPATLKCTVCPSNHDIIPTDGSGLVILICDQNFVSALAGGASCIPIIRLEDGTLDELTNITLEILNRQNIPPGTIFMLNSVSHLAKVGTTQFAFDWNLACRKLTNRWRNARVGPLSPILREDCSWFQNIYSESPVYAKQAWNRVIEAIGSTDEVGLDLGHSAP